MRALAAVCRVAVVACLSLVFGFSGCEKAADSSAAKPLRMAGIIFQEDQFFRLILFGMKDAAKKNNVELLEGNSDNKPDEEFQLVQTYTGQNVDAILISPLSAKGSIAAIKQAHDKGLIVVTNNSAIDADFPDADVESSASDLGHQTGSAARKYIEDKLGGKANIAILAFKSQVAEQSDARTGGFKDEVLKLPGVKIIAEQDAWLSEMAVQKAGEILTVHPEINIIYGANEGGTAGAVLAVKNAGKAGQIAVFGTDVSQQLLDFLQSPDNILQAITAQRPFEMGQRSVEVALAAIRRQPYDKKIVLNGICLTHADPDGVKAYAKQLQDWTAGGN
jgi:simple sugar transport system substrate-binding protein/ribose transport system substrate-binding protein